LTVQGHRQYNPGWHLSLDIANMLRVSECIAKAALVRQESRGGHTRDDYPQPDPAWAGVNVVLHEVAGQVFLIKQEMPPMPPDLAELLTQEPTKEA